MNQHVHYMQLKLSKNMAQSKGALWLLREFYGVILFIKGDMIRLNRKLGGVNLTNYLSGIFEQIFYAVHNFVQLFTTNPEHIFWIAIILFTLIVRICLLPLSLSKLNLQQK